MQRLEFIFSHYTDDVGMRLLKRMDEMLMADGLNLFTPVREDPAIEQRTKEEYERKVLNKMSFKVVEQRIRSRDYRDSLVFDFLVDLFLIPSNITRFDPKRVQTRELVEQRFYSVFPELNGQPPSETRTHEQLAVISAYLCSCEEAQFVELFEQDTDLMELSFSNYLRIYRICLHGLFKQNQVYEELDFSVVTIDLQ